MNSDEVAKNILLDKTCDTCMSHTRADSCYIYGATLDDPDLDQDCPPERTCDQFVVY